MTDRGSRSPTGRRRSTAARRRRRATIARRWATILFTLAVVIVLVLATTHSGHHAASTTSTSAPPRTTTTTTSPTTTTDPGLLPQTNAEPSFGAPLHAQMSILFRSLVANDPSIGQAVFFPESAYVSMKTGILPDPRADYANRLIAFFNLDVAAYHAQLAMSPAPATLTEVLANPADAAWIPPGTCENSVGYWHLPGVRLVYSQGGAVSSFGVASLISWRGVWYVVHLGPNPRPSNVGTVDAPASGPGVPGPAGGC